MFKKLIYIIIAVLFLISCANKVSVQVEYKSSEGKITGIGDYMIEEDVKLRATPNDGYKFIGWFKRGKKVEDNHEYNFNATKDLELLAKFEQADTTDYIDYNFTKVLLSDDKKHVLGIGKSKILVRDALSLETVSEVELDKDQKVTKINWYTNSSFLYLTKGKLILHHLDGTSEIIYDNLEYNPLASLEGDNLKHSISSITEENNKFKEENNYLKVEIYNMKGYLATIKYPIVTQSYAYTLPDTSPNYSYAAMTSGWDLYIYNLANDYLLKLDLDRYVHPVSWKDDSNLIINQQTVIHSHGARRPIIKLSNYNIENDKLINIVNTLGVENGYSFSPDKSSLLYVNVLDTKEGLIYETRYVDINYEKIQQVSGDSTTNDDSDYSQRYKVTDTKLLNLDSSFFNILKTYWINNDKVVFVGSIDGRQVTYLYNNKLDKLTRIPITPKQIVGTIDDLLLYTNGEEPHINNIKHFNLDSTN